MKAKKQVRSRHGTTDWFQIGKGECQGCLLSPCLFNLYAEYIKQNARLDELQAGMKTSGRNINNLRYAYDTTLIAKSEEEQRDQIASIHWIIKKAREFQKNIYFCFIDYAKTSDYMDHNKLWKIVKKMGIPDHLICLLRNFKKQ